MSQATEQLIALTQQLLGAIAARDWKVYAELCDTSLTCFEPEAQRQLVAGLEFHKYYFELPGSTDKRNTTLCSPHVRFMGEEAAVVSYIRLIQLLDAAGKPQTVSFEETRVWQKIGGRWKHVHFHRS